MILGRATARSRSLRRNPRPLHQLRFSMTEHSRFERLMSKEKCPALFRLKMSEGSALCIKFLLNMMRESRISARSTCPAAWDVLTIKTCFPRRRTITPTREDQEVRVCLTCESPVSQLDRPDRPLRPTPQRRASSGSVRRSSPVLWPAPRKRSDRLRILVGDTTQPTGGPPPVSG